MCHKERRIWSRKPKELRSSHWGRPYPKGKYCGFFSRHPKLIGDQGLLVSRNIVTTISVHFLCGFHIEIGNAYLPRSLRVEHTPCLTDDRKVREFSASVRDDR
jgi:hypothetical protein